MGKANLHPDFKAFLKSLNSAGVRYLLVGGYAVNFHGYHRHTEDIDVWIAIDPENLKKVSQALQSFGGFSPSQVAPEAFARPGHVFMFGREPVRIDILTGPSGVDFDRCWQRRGQFDLDGVTVSIISLDDLKTNKRASGRPKDIADLASLPSKPLWPKKSRPRKRPGTGHK